MGKLLNDTTMANLSWRTPAQGLGYLVLLFALGTSFGVMAINVLIWQVEMLIVGLAVLILLPTLIFRSMAWMALG